MGEEDEMGETTDHQREVHYPVQSPKKPVEIDRVSKQSLVEWLFIACVR